MKIKISILRYKSGHSKAVHVAPNNRSGIVAFSYKIATPMPTLGVLPVIYSDIHHFMNGIYY